MFNKPFLRRKPNAFQSAQCHSKVKLLSLPCSQQNSSLTSLFFRSDLRLASACSHVAFQMSSKWESAEEFTRHTTQRSWLMTWENKSTGEAPLSVLHTSPTVSTSWDVSVAFGKCCCQSWLDQTHRRSLDQIKTICKFHWQRNCN